MKISTRRIRERLEEDFPRIDWRVKKRRNHPQWYIFGSIYRHKFTKELVSKERIFEPNIEELAATQIVELSHLALAFADLIDDIGRGFYNDMERKDSEKSSSN